MRLKGTVRGGKGKEGHHHHPTLLELRLDCKRLLKSDCSCRERSKLDSPLGALISKAVLSCKHDKGKRGGRN